MRHPTLLSRIFFDHPVTRRSLAGYLPIDAMFLPLRTARLAPNASYRGDRCTTPENCRPHLRPNHTNNWMPPAGKSAIIRVRGRYVYKGGDFGNWSPGQNWTLTGE